MINNLRAAVRDVEYCERTDTDLYRRAVAILHVRAETVSRETLKRLARDMRADATRYRKRKMALGREQKPKAI